MNYIKSPREIEKLSFSIIEKLVGESGFLFPHEMLEVAKRVVHTGGYVSILKDFNFSQNAFERFKEMIKKGYAIVSDTYMAKMGINTGYCPEYKNSVRCYAHDEEVIREAKKKGVTRAISSCDKAIRFPDNKIFVVGNSPTFLFRLLEHYDMGNIKELFVVGVPVGFVGAKESKKELTKRDIPYITIHGTKGGTTYGVAIINALLKLVGERE